MKILKEKIVKFLLLVLLALPVFLSNNSVALAYEQETIDEEFKTLQNKIDSKLDIVYSNGEYVYLYNYDDIKEIIYHSGFDFKQFNDRYGTNYDESSFLKAVITSIDTTKLRSNITPIATYCNHNESTEGWNYYREFMSESVSKTTISDLRQTATNFRLGGTAGGILIGTVSKLFGGVFKIGTAYDAWYFDTLANSIEANLSGCGSVVDVNKFTTVFTVWDQRNF